MGRVRRVDNDKANMAGSWQPNEGEPNRREELNRYRWLEGERVEPPGVGIKWKGSKTVKVVGDGSEGRGRRR